MNDDKFLDDDIDSCPDNTTLGKSKAVKVDAVETGEKSSEDSDTV